MRRIAVAMQKGGVGKTTTTANLAVALAARGQRVLVIDMDPQCQQALVFKADVRELTVADFMMRGAALEDVRIPIAANLDLIPAETEWTAADAELLPLLDGRHRLLKRLIQIDNEYDFAIIDTPPNLGGLTANGLVAAQDLLVPVETSQAALAELPKFLETYTAIRDNLNPTLRLLAILPTKFDGRLTHDTEVLQLLRDNPDGYRCLEPVPLRVAIKVCFAHGPVAGYDPVASAAFTPLADLVMEEAA